jgi:transcriptional regulator with XRE-family HTH domain
MRKAANATQSQIADAINSTQTTVARLERGEMRASSSTALVLRILQAHLSRGGRLSSFASTFTA